MANNVAALNDAEIQTALAKLSGWEYDAQNKCLHKSYALKSYFKGLSFVQTIGWLAQKMNHHPDITLTFSLVTVKLTTHDAGNSVSALDLLMAQQIDQLWF